MANVPERRVVVYPCIDEAPIDQAAIDGALHKRGSANRERENEARQPSLAEFGWDFPFNSPKRAQ
jgi:hypothetical protein